MDMNTPQPKVLLIQDNTEQDSEINFSRIWLVFLRRKWLIILVFVLTGIATALYTLRLENEYEAIAIIKVPLASSGALSGLLSSLSPIGSANSADTEIAIIKGRRLAENVVGELGLDKENPELNWRQTVSKLRNSIEAKLKTKTNLIEITVTHKNPAKASVIANKIAEEYLKLAAYSAQNAWESLINQMGSELEQTKINLDRSRQLLHQYESGKGITMAFGDLLLGQGATRSFAMREATESIGSLRADIMRMEVQLETMLKTTSEGSPNVIRLKNQIDVTKGKLQEAEQKAIEKYNKQFGLSDAAAEVAFNQQLYNLLVTKHEELKAQYIMQKSMPEIVEEALEPLIPKPKKRMFLVVGLTLGLFLSIGIALLKEYRDQSIHNLEDMTRFIKTPTIGSIPEFDRNSNNELIINNLPADNSINRIFVDSYRLLHLGIISEVNKHRDEIFNEHKSDGLTLLVTSSIDGEGKSTVAANLAISLASSGKKVLLVDANIKNPIQHQLMKLDLKPGLLDYLKGDCSWQDIIKNNSLNGLHVISSGNINDISNPIMSDYLREFMQLAKEEFDFIIFDSASAISSAEPSAIGALADGVLLVIKANNTKRDVIIASKNRIQDSGGYVIGGVLNRINYGKKYKKYYK